jgi:hypothetical protein
MQMWVFDVDSNVWQVVQAPVGQAAPSARASHALVVLPSTNPSNITLFLFGGWTADGASCEAWILSDVLSPDRAQWLLVGPLPVTAQPQGRFAFAAGLLQSAVVVFGGACMQGTNWSACNQGELLWTFDITSLQWTRHAILAPSPSARIAPLHTVTPAGLVVVGGAASVFAPPFSLAEVWTLSIVSTTLSWRLIQAIPPATPAALMVGGLVFFRDHLVAFGGTSFPLDTQLALGSIVLFPSSSSATLVLDNSTWQVLGAQSAPQQELYPYARVAHSLTVVGTGVLLFGGFNPFGRTMFDNLWALQPGPSWAWWARVKPLTRPPPRFAHTVVRLDNKLMLFGGITPSHVPVSDLWAFDLDTLTYTCLFNSNVPKSYPRPRASHSAVAYNDETMIIFGGTYVGETGDVTYYNDLWMFNVLNRSWTLSLPQMRPAPCGKHSAVVYLDTMILFGGSLSDNVTNAVWFFNITQRAWTPLALSSSSSAPSARSGHIAAVLAGPDGSQTMYMFGGRSLTDVLGDMWALDLNAAYVTASRWRQLILPLNPSPRFNFCAAVLGGMQKMVVFGGAASINYSQAYWDTWTFVGGATETWSVTEVPDAGVPVFDVACEMAGTNTTGFYLVQGRATNSFFSMDFLQYVELGCNPVRIGFFFEIFVRLMFSICCCFKFTLRLLVCSLWLRRAHL